MARFSIFLFLVSWSALQAFGQEGRVPENPDSLFLRLENELMDAVMNRDREVMERMLHEAYLLTSSESSGGLVPKQAYINGSMNPAVLAATAFEFLSMSAQMVGSDVAIVRSQLDWRSTYQGAPWNAKFLMTDIWALSDDGSWKLVSRHSSYPADELARIVRERHGGADGGD